MPLAAPPPAAWVDAFPIINRDVRCHIHEHDRRRREREPPRDVCVRLRPPHAAVAQPRTPPSNIPLPPMPSFWWRFFVRSLRRLPRGPPTLPHAPDTCLFDAVAARRQLARAASFPRTGAATSSARCAPAGYGALAKKHRLLSTPAPPALSRLREYLSLMRALDTAPWANVVFDVNDRMLRVLTATHLHLIVGKKNFRTCNRAALMRLIDPERDLDGLSNVVWVTNRQQGKTSTLGKFIASLAIHSDVSGSLCNVQHLARPRQRADRRRQKVACSG